MSNLNVRIIIDAVTEGVSRGINEVETRLGAMGRNIISTFTSIQSLIAVTFVGVMIGAAVNIARGFDVINASIKTATKGMENEAIPALKDFAKTTPYDLAQVSEAFVKLVNFGLTPSEAALTSYGNTASALGKNLNQMVEAVADAVTGEFERLKEFGIKSKVEGDNVIFTFQGVKTTVKNNAAAIEQYLIRLGEVNFAGAMADRAKKLDGALSNLSDSWSNLVLTVMQSGFSDFIAENARSASESLDSISQYIESGVLQASIATITTAFDGMGRDVTQSMGIVTDYIKQQFAEWTTAGTDSAHALTTEFQNWINNTRSFIKIMTVEAASMWDKLKILTDSGLQSMRKPMEVQQEKLEGINKARQDTISLILDEHNKQTVANKAAITASDAIVKSLEREAAAHKKNEDRLAKFKIGIPSTDTGMASSAVKRKSSAVHSAPAESEMHKFDFGLEQQKIAFAKSHNLREMSKQEEKKYWDDIIATYNGNGKTLANLKKKSADLELAILRDKGQKGKNVENEIALETLSAEHAAALDKLTAQEVASKQELDLGHITKEQHLEALRKFAADRLAIEKKYIDDKAALTKTADAQESTDLHQKTQKDTLELEKGNHQKEALERESAAKTQDIDNQEALDKKDHFKALFEPLNHALDQSVDSILSGQQTIKNAAKNAAQSIVLSYASTFIKTRLLALAEWAWEVAGFGAKETTKTGIKAASEGSQAAAAVAGDTVQTASKVTAEGTKKAVTATSAVSSIMVKAADAAAGAYNAVVGIPIVGPILAPIAAGVAYVGVAAFSALVGSAKGGEWQVGADGSPYILHEKESVLPAGVAENFRKVVNIVNHHVGNDGADKNSKHIETINLMIASGQLKRLALPDFAVNFANSSQSAANAFARDRVNADKERSSNPATAKSGDIQIHMNGLMLAPEDFLKQHSKVLVKIAKDEARKFSGGR